MESLSIILLKGTTFMKTFIISSDPPAFSATDCCTEIHHRVSLFRQIMIMVQYFILMKSSWQGCFYFSLIWCFIIMTNIFVYLMKESRENLFFLLYTKISWTVVEFWESSRCTSLTCNIWCALDVKLVHLLLSQNYISYPCSGLASK